MLEKITDKTYYMKHNDETDRPALGLIVGDNACLIVDAGTSPKHAMDFKALMKDMNLPPIKYLVITHYHFDHSFGLSEWDVVSIANNKTTENLKKYQKLKYDDDSLKESLQKGILSKELIKNIRAEKINTDQFCVGNIHLTYKDSIMIDLGGVSCLIQHITSPHSDDSTIVYVQEEKTMFVGDCFYGHNMGGFNYFDKEKLNEMVECMSRYDVDYYLCAHESICDKKEIEGYWSQLLLAAEFAKASSNFEEAKVMFRNKLQKEPNSDEEFYIRSFGIGEGWGRIIK